MRKRKEKVLEVAAFLCGPIELDGALARFTLEAKETGSLRPDVLLEHCAIPAQVVSVTRVEQRESL